MSLDIMFLTNDNLRRMRKDPVVLGLRYRGFSNGVENDQNTANQLKNGDVPHKRTSNSSTVSNQSYDSEHPKQYNGSHRSSHSSEASAEVHNIYGQKPSNPLYGVNAASQYAPLNINYKDLEENKAKELRISENPMPNGVRKAPEGQDTEPYVEDDLDGRPEQIAAGVEAGSTHYSTNDNGKINVHVTVMINAGTLADLKKQRSQIRTNGSPVDQNSIASNNHSLSSLPETTPVVVAPVITDMPVQLNPLNLSPSTGTVPRFSGNTGDVVGDSRSHRCCVIM